MWQGMTRSSKTNMEGTVHSLCGQKETVCPNGLVEHDSYPMPRIFIVPKQHNLRLNLPQSRIHVIPMISERSVLICEYVG